MSLEEAMAKLADAMNRYSETIEKYGDALLTRLGEADVAAVAAGGKADKPAAAPKKGAAKKTAASAPPAEEEEEEEEEDDGLGGGTTNRSEDEVKTILKKFKDAGGVPKEIMGKFGARSFPEVKPAHFNAVYEATEKALAKL